MHPYMFVMPFDHILALDIMVGQCGKALQPDRVERMSRSSILRALVDALYDAEPDLSDVDSEEDLRRRLRISLKPVR